MDKPNPEYRPVDRDSDRQVITPVDSRQGIMLGRVRWILGISLALVIIAFVSLYAVHFGSNPHAANGTGQVSASNTVSPAGASNTAGRNGS